MKKTILSICILLWQLNVRSQTFSSTVNQTIPDNNTTVAFNLVVSGLPSVIDTSFGLEQVCLTMTHTYCSDMDVKLKAPDGTTTTLFSGVGGGNDDFTNTCLNGIGTPIAAGSAPFTGTYQSMGMLGNVNNGQNPNGTWQLLCTDMAAVDIGFLINWSVTFSNNPAMPFMFESSNLPIVILTTLASPISNDPKVPVLMQIIDNGPGLLNYSNQTDYAYEGRIMTEWQGYSGPSYPKKNYDLNLIDTLGNNIDTSLLGMPAENDWIFKAEYLDHSLIKNQIAYEFARRMGNYAPRTRPCEIILDGEYIGYYTLTEKVKRDANRIDIAKLTTADISGSALTGGYIIEMNINGDAGAWNSVFQPINNATCGFPVEFKYVYPKPTVILPVQQDYIHAYVDSFEAVLNGPNYLDSTTGYRNYIDVSTFIDFLIVNEFTVNYDSYGRSTYMYKEKDTDGGKLKIGPPWDYDRAVPYDNPNATDGWVWEITHPYWPFPFWWSKMWTDVDYRKELACRWTSLRETSFQTDSFVAYIDTMEVFLSQAAGRNFTVWNDLGGSTYDVQIDSVKSFITRRLNWMDEQMAIENVTLPNIYLPSDTIVCAGTLYDASFNGLQYDYNWQPGPDSSLITFNTSGIYHLKVTGNHGCYTIKTMDVTISIPDASFISTANGGTVDWSFAPNNINGTNYAWNFGDATSSGSTNPTHSYNANGSYVVSLSITDSLGCVQTSTDTLQVNSIGIGEISLLEDQVYPNPFEDKIQINLADLPQEEIMVSLINEMGQKILTKTFMPTQTSITLFAEQFPSGIYLLQFSSGTRSWVKKIVKK